MHPPYLYMKRCYLNAHVQRGTCIQLRHSQFIQGDQTSGKRQPSSPIPLLINSFPCWSIFAGEIVWWAQTITFYPFISAMSSYLAVHIWFNFNPSLEESFDYIYDDIYLADFGNTFPPWPPPSSPPLKPELSWEPSPWASMFLIIVVSLNITVTKVVT